MRAKEYLLQEGKITSIGRGRMSLDSHAFLKEALGKGIKFSDYPLTPTGPKPTKPKTSVSKPNAPKPAPRVSSGIAEIPSQVWTKAFRIIDGKKIPCGIAEACNNCRVSVGWCTCAYFGRTPTVVALDGRGLVPVHLEV